MEGGLCREARRGVPYHHRAAPRQVGADASAPAAVAEVEVVQETLATADGVGPLLRWREREEEGYSEGSGREGGGRLAARPSHTPAHATHNCVDVINLH